MRTCHRPFDHQRTGEGPSRTNNTSTYIDSFVFAQRAFVESCQVPALLELYKLPCHFGDLRRPSSNTAFTDFGGTTTSQWSICPTTCHLPHLTFDFHLPSSRPPQSTAKNRPQRQYSILRRLHLNQPHRNNYHVWCQSSQLQQLTTVFSIMETYMYFPTFNRSVPVHRLLKGPSSEDSWSQPLSRAGSSLLPCLYWQKCRVWTCGTSQAATPSSWRYKSCSTRLRDPLPRYC